MLCQCYKSKSQTNLQCPHKALNGSKYCGIHRNCQIIFGQDLLLQDTERRDMELNAKQDAERKAKQDMERKTKQDAERRTKQDMEMRIKQDAERRAKQDMERKNYPHEGQNPKKFVVFDFDCTLTYAHSHYFVSNIDYFCKVKNWINSYDKTSLKNLSEKVWDLISGEELDDLSNTQERNMLVNIIFGGQDRLQQIREFLTQLQKMSCELFIASKGLFITIEQLLKFVELDSFFMPTEERISANKGPMEYSKGEFIMVLHKENPDAKIYYIDDDSTEHKDFLQEEPDADQFYSYYGENIGLKKDQNGLTQQMMNQLINLISSQPITKKLSPGIKQQPRQLKVLSGPSLFAFYPNLDGKRILLLGEYHSTDKLCPSKKDTYEVHDWLYDLALSAPDCLDIMVEFMYLREKNKLNIKMFTGPTKRLNMYSYPIEGIMHKFNKCYTKQKPTDCVSSRLRFHYLDVREFDGFGVIRPLSDDSPTFSKNIVIKYTPLQRSLYEYILGISTDEKTYQLYHAFFQDVCQSLHTNINVEQLDDFTTTYWSIIRKEYAKFPMSNQEKNRFINTLIETMISQGPLFGLTNAKIYMDAYCLLRLFMKFDFSQQKRLKGPSGCQSEKFNTMQNIIIYTGVYHTRTYITFFKLFFNQLPQEKTYIDDAGLLYKTQCIALSQPFDFFGE